MPPAGVGTGVEMSCRAQFINSNFAASWGALQRPSSNWACQTVVARGGPAFRTEEEVFGESASPQNTCNRPRMSTAAAGEIKSWTPTGTPTEEPVSDPLEPLSNFHASNFWGLLRAPRSNTLPMT